MLSDPPQDSEQPSDDLQFDRVELEPAAYRAEGPSPGSEGGAGMQCALSGEEILGVYYEVNGRVLSEGSYRQVEALRQKGSGIGRFLRAGLVGGGAGALGALVYYFFLSVIGLEWAVISILVGYMVGYGVHLGSRSRGGLPYQLLAVFLTYAAIVLAYVPLVAEGLRELDGMEAGPVVEGSAEPATGLFAEDEDSAPAEELEREDGVPDFLTTSGQDSAAAERPQAPGEDGFDPALENPITMKILFALTVLVISCMAPFFGGWASLLSVLIIGFGLFQAWKMNRKHAFEVAGPFQLGQASRVDEAWS